MWNVIYVNSWLWGYVCCKSSKKSHQLDVAHILGICVVILFNVKCNILIDIIFCNSLTCNDKFVHYSMQSTYLSFLGKTAVLCGHYLKCSAASPNNMRHFAIQKCFFAVDFLQQRLNFIGKPNLNYNFIPSRETYWACICLYRLYLGK